MKYVYQYQYVSLCHLQILHIKAHWTLFNINVYFNSTSNSANAQYVNVKRLDQISFTISFTFLEQELLHNDTCQSIYCINTRNKIMIHDRSIILRIYVAWVFNVYPGLIFQKTTVRMTVQLNLRQCGRKYKKISNSIQRHHIGRYLNGILGYLCNFNLWTQKRYR